MAASEIYVLPSIQFGWVYHYVKEKSGCAQEFALMKNSCWESILILFGCECVQERCSMYKNLDKIIVSFFTYWELVHRVICVSTIKMMVRFRCDNLQIRLQGSMRGMKDLERNGLLPEKLWAGAFYGTVTYKAFFGKWFLVLIWLFDFLNQFTWDTEVLNSTYNLMPLSSYWSLEWYVNSLFYLCSRWLLYRYSGTCCILIGPMLMNVL